MFNNYKRDVVEDAQLVMNANKSMENKNLISALANEVIALRVEIERLETKLLKATSPTLVKSLHVTFDRDGQVDSVESKNYG